MTRRMAAGVNVRSVGIIRGGGMCEVDAFSPQVDSGRDCFQSSPLPSLDGQ